MSVRRSTTESLGLDDRGRVVTPLSLGVLSGNGGRRGRSGLGRCRRGECFAFQLHVGIDQDREFGVSENGGVFAGGEG
jgi:hypothetical protein